MTSLQEGILIVACAIVAIRMYFGIWMREVLAVEKKKNYPQRHLEASLIHWYSLKRDYGGGANLLAKIHNALSILTLIFILGLILSLSM